jgi:hypothetical protein
MEDCAGECGGSAMEDCAGDCNGSAMDDCAGDCNGSAIDDCAGDCGGSAEEDACGVCAGLEIDYDNCVQEGYLLSFGSVDIENGTLEIIMNNQTAVAGFQFDMSGLNITAASGGSAETNGFFMSVSGSTVLGFSLSGATIPPSNGVLVNLSFNGPAEELCLSNPILSSESGNQLDTDLGDCVDGIELIYGCLDEGACNYNPLATAEGNCDYPEENIDCDGNCVVDIDCTGECGGIAQVDECGVCGGDGSDDIGCGCFEDGPSGCDNTCGSTLELDECGVCDGDNSTCSGCTDDSAFNSNCLNGNWPNSAVFGCNEEVLISDNSCIYAPQGFEFNQSITQAFYKFINASFNDSPLIFMGSWIGAFKDGVCVGSWPWVGEFTTVPVMGDDGNEYSSGYMLNGEVPEFYIYDPLLDYSYKANTSDHFEWSNLEIFHVENLYFDFDCEQEIGGNNSYDECGVCGGDAFINLCLGSNDCLGMDCLGICGGSEFCDSDIIYSWDDLGYTVGDVNFDHNTNVVDIANQVNFILDNSSPNYYEFWASDMNQDSNLNVIDAVNLSGHILGLMRSNINSQAYIDNKTLSISNNIGGIQFSGDLLSDVIGNDIKVSNGNKSLIYNVEGELSTKEFIFKNKPTNLLVVDLNGELLNISSAPNYSLKIYPNPFNPTTSINFAISKSENVSISVYNLQGKEVASLINGKYNIGYHSVVWNADKYISGVYFVKIVVGEYISSQKVILVK